jgi:hypothetical protein
VPTRFLKCPAKLQNSGFLPKLYVKEFIIFEVKAEVEAERFLTSTLTLTLVYLHLSFLLLHLPTLEGV